MAYDSSKLGLVSQGVAGFGKEFVYDSTDAATAVRVDGYITDAADRGVAVGDIVRQIDSVGGTVAHTYVVKAVNANGSADLSDGSATVVTDTD